MMMKCNDIQIKLMDYLDEALPESEMRQVREHLQGCNECSALYHKIQESWSLAKKDRIEPQPFFHTRVQQALENRKSSGTLEWKQFARQALQPALFFVVLGLGIFIGIQLGRGIDTRSLAENQVQSQDYIEEYAENQYLDGMKLETLEQEMFLEDSSYTAVPSEKTKNNE
jgi:predicted anti-sigma-YlaC factor YlaD